MRAIFNFLAIYDRQSIILNCKDIQLNWRDTQVFMSESSVAVMHVAAVALQLHPCAEW